MVFNSLTFILFFAGVLFLHHLPFPWRIKKAQLVLASYLFYAAWNPPFVILLWLSTITDWFVAGAIARTTGKSFKRFLLILSLSVNLGLLGFFKYGDFVLRNFVWLADQLGIAFQPVQPDVVLPVGISFYTFQSLSYTLDIYKGKMDPWPSFLDFAMFVTFFPQLVAGPIVRAADFLPQCKTPRSASPRQMAWGMMMLSSGLFQKIILADALMAPVSDRVFGAAQQAGAGDAWIGTLAFSAQIFFDFSGYSTCAIGAALCLGFVLPDNFRFPYGAVGFREFWKRWHISLSTWLRDYLYISLGGNRTGRVRTLVNIMLTMLIGGLWHGASWRFVVWGGLHGIYLVAERLIADRVKQHGRFDGPGSRISLALLTYLLVCITWVFFRAQAFPDAFQLVRVMLSGGASQIVTSWDIILVGVLNAALFSGHYALRKSSIEAVIGRFPWQLRTAVISVILITLALAPGDDRAFIYFQF